MKRHCFANVRKNMNSSCEAIDAICRNQLDLQDFVLTWDWTEVVCVRPSSVKMKLNPVLRHENTESLTYSGILVCIVKDYFSCFHIHEILAFYCLCSCSEIKMYTCGFCSRYKELLILFYPECYMNYTYTLNFSKSSKVQLIQQIIKTPFT